MRATELTESAESMAGIAGGRATLYGLLVSIFSDIPDDTLISRIKGVYLENLLNACCGLGSRRFRSGIGLVNSYRAGITLKKQQEVLQDLSVDRTRILRGTGHRQMKPPFEGLYKKRENIGESILEVKRFYRKAGLVPDESVHESPDYLTIELDFMKQLCLREQGEWSANQDATKTIAQEETFLRQHLGSWVSDFCAQVEKHSITDFYRGFCIIMDAFIGSDLEYLQELAAPLR